MVFLANRPPYTHTNNNDFYVFIEARMDREGFFMWLELELEDKKFENPEKKWGKHSGITSMKAKNYNAKHWHKLLLWIQSKEKNSEVLDQIVYTIKWAATRF